MTYKKAFKISVLTFIFIFILMNIVAIFHAYKFTHFDESISIKTNDPKKLTKTQKISTLFFGINNPRPNNEIFPKSNYETLNLKSNKNIECWSIKVEKAKGTVVIFHGYSGQKSSMLEHSDIFNVLGFNTLLVDFMGSGLSEGNQTTIGFYEAEQVKTCFDYLERIGESNIILFGTSMGAVAIMKAINDFRISPKKIILECPFGSMYKTVCARFKAMNAPTFPMASLLMFWGGVINGFWAFNHNPIEYSKSITCPTLLLYGEKDEKVSKEEIDDIFENLICKKELNLYKEAGHESYLIKYMEQWKENVSKFLNRY